MDTNQCAWEFKIKIIQDVSNEWLHVKRSIIKHLSTKYDQMKLYQYNNLVCAHFSVCAVAHFFGCAIIGCAFYVAHFFLFAKLLVAHFLLRIFLFAYLLVAHLSVAHFSGIPWRTVMMTPRKPKDATFFWKLYLVISIYFLKIYELINYRPF